MACPMTARKRLETDKSECEYRRRSRLACEFTRRHFFAFLGGERGTKEPLLRQITSFYGFIG